jgi:sirohydrochlorin cobaltochelatase
MSNPPQRALLLFCHGSSDPEWALPFMRLREQVAASAPGDLTALAYLAPAQPSFEEVVAQLAAAGIKQVVVAPVFFARGSHVKKDLPALVEKAVAQHGISFRVLPTIGEVDVLLQSISAWVIESANA